MVNHDDFSIKKDGKGGESVNPNKIVVPFGNLLHSELENHHFEWVNQRTKWAIFNSYVKLPVTYQWVNHDDFSIFSGSDFYWMMFLLMREIFMISLWKFAIGKIKHPTESSDNMAVNQ